MKFYYFCKYACMEACQDMKQKSWINAPIHIYELGGSVTRILVPDSRSFANVKLCAYTKNQRHPYE